MSGPLGALQPASDGSAADWVFEALYAFKRSAVGSVIPSGFDAYACLLHSGRSDDDQMRGRPRLEEIRSLADALRSATSTPETCWFCIWIGWGWLHVSAGSIAHLGGEPPDWRDPLVEVERFAASASVVGNPYREYHLFSGPVDAVVDSALPSFSHDVPSLWWPDDRAWIVATEVDLSWTYVGATEPATERVLDVWPFDGKRVTPDDPFEGDKLA
jgi:hypothetical protein